MAAERQEENLILRDCLALERTNQANERTFLAYARTAVMALFTGISLFKLFPESMAMYVFGWTSILVSFILFFWGLKKFVTRFRSITALQSQCSVFMNTVPSISLSRAWDSVGMVKERRCK